MVQFRNSYFPGKEACEQTALENSETQSPLKGARGESAGSNITKDDLFLGKDLKHLILRHNKSGDFFYSKIPNRLSEADLYGNGGLDLQLEMPSGITTSTPQSCFLRWLLTVLHGITCLVSGFCCIFSLFGTLFSDHCLPYVVNKDGSFIESHFGFTTFCDGVISGLGFVFVVSLLMCGLVQCSINRTLLMVLSVFLTVCMFACSVVAGSMFTIHYAVWCDSISQNLDSRHVKCDDAAKQFDLLHKATSMQTFETQMELQQISAWTLFPLTFITLLCYSLAMRWGHMPSSNEGDPPPRGFYQYLATQNDSERESNRDSDSNRPQSDACDESSPFLNNEL
ncbi:hypothetical protein EGW08_022688 [Elysia chlorotica]|uniref:Uncharacterized protein n=1 Tax=Elysia chlorotica TaxID=188477 RepID=A0A3S1AQX0_ELYCH|nr:hypothetical protein EGW08_022688 [Elysia chlorotica]